MSMSRGVVRIWVQDLGAGGPINGKTGRIIVLDGDIVSG
jgi:hypothetical protein